MKNSVKFLGRFCGLVSLRVFPCSHSDLLSFSPFFLPTRFQLQRLFARISVTDRLDLLGPLMVYFLANYPERTTPLPTPSNLYSSTLTGSDLRVFNRLVCSPNLPRGTEYLLLLAKDQSWLQEDDASLTAMLTLKHVYGFMPGIVPFSGKTPAAEMTSYVTRSDRQRRYNHYSTGERPGLADVFVPGTDLVHGLLIASIKDKRELQVKRLLTFGATTRPAVEPIDDGKPDRVMFPMRDLPVPKFKRTMYILYKQCKKRGISSPYMTTSHGGFEEDDNIFVYGADGRLRRKFELNPFDAVEVAAIKGNVNILRMILEEDNKHGRWETPEGQETLSKCLLMCEDKLDCYDLIKAFLGGDREPAMDLMKALLDGDKDKAIELLAKGIKLSTEQISVILKSPENAQVHELVIELTNLDLNDLKNLLPSLFHTCTRHYGLMTSADAHEQHPTPAALLRKYESQMTTKEGRKFLKGYFSRQSCIQHLIRPYLGGLQEHAPSSEVLRFDLVHAVIDNDKDKMTRLVECGVKPTCWLRFLPEIPSLNTGNGQERTEGVKTFLKLGLLSKKDIQKVLEMIVRPGQRNASADLLEYLLDESNGHPVPKIKINILFCAISWLGLAETGNTLQCMLLERAIAENANIAKHRAEIDRAVARYGPNSDFAVQWASYKEKLDKEAPAEKQDKEESGDDEEDDLMSTPFYYDMPFGHDDDDLYY